MLEKPTINEYPQAMLDMASQKSQSSQQFVYETDRLMKSLKLEKQEMEEAKAPIPNS